MSLCPFSSFCVFSSFFSSFFVAAAVVAVVDDVGVVVAFSLLSLLSLSSLFLSLSSIMERAAGVTGLKADRAGEPTEPTVRAESEDTDTDADAGLTGLIGTDSVELGGELEIESVVDADVDVVACRGEGMAIACVVECVGVVAPSDTVVVVSEVKERACVRDGGECVIDKGPGRAAAAVDVVDVDADADADFDCGCWSVHLMSPSISSISTENTSTAGACLDSNAHITSK